MDNTGIQYVKYTYSISNLLQYKDTYLSIFTGTNERHLLIAIERIAAGDAAEGPDDIVVTDDAHQRLLAGLSEVAEQREVVAKCAAVQVPLIRRYIRHRHKIHVKERERQIFIGLSHQLRHAARVESTMPKQ